MDVQEFQLHLMDNILTLFENLKKSEDNKNVLQSYLGLLSHGNTHELQDYLLDSCVEPSLVETGARMTSLRVLRGDKALNLG